MKKNLTLLNAAMILIALAPLIYVLILWNSIPSSIPIHFDANLKPDRMGTRNDLLLASGILAGVSVLMLFLCENIQRFDPKRRNAPVSFTFIKLAAGLVVFMSALNFMLVLSSVRSTLLINQFLFPLLGLLFAFLGNYMNNIKPNFFVGFRLPWTLSDDENWRKTHHLAGKLWFWGGLAFAIISLFLPSKPAFTFFICIVIVMAIIPIGYSYNLFRTKTS
jgi:uncharacterized membrane protein